MVFTRKNRREENSKENVSPGTQSDKNAGSQTANTQKADSQNANTQKAGSQNAATQKSTQKTRTYRNGKKSRPLATIPDNLITVGASHCAAEQSLPKEQPVAVEVRDHSVSSPLLEKEVTTQVALDLVVHESNVAPSTSISPIDVVGTADLNSSNPPDVTKKSGIPRRVRMSELEGDARVQAQETEKLRKKIWRAKKKGLPLPAEREGSVNRLPKIPIAITPEGQLIGDLLNVARKLLSMLVQETIPAHTYASEMTRDRHEGVYKSFVSKFDGGESIKREWVKKRVIDMMRTNRKKSCGVAKKQLEFEESIVSGSSPSSTPQKLKDDVFDFFVKELKSEAFKEDSGKKQKMSLDMVAKRGCGNPLGHGGLSSHVARHVSEYGSTFNIN